MSADEKAENEARIRELSRTPPIVAQPRRKQRFLNGLLYVMTAVTLALIVVSLITYTRQSNSALQQARANKATQVAVCVQSNQARAQIKKLWQFIIDTSRKNNPHPTAKQAQLLRDFQKQVDDAYQQRDCSQPGK